MKRLLVFLALGGFLLSSSPSFGKGIQEYKVDIAHTKIGFEISHLVISTVEGQFKTFSGSYKFDGKKHKVSEIKFEIDAASIDTNEKDRDEHLSSDDFFNVKKYPKIEFKSVKVQFRGETPVKVTGKLKMHGKTRKVDLDVAWKGEVTDPWGNHKQVFELRGKIKRADFGLTWNKALDKGGVMIGKNVDLIIRVEANMTKKKTEKK